MTARKGNIYTGCIRSALRTNKKVWLSKITVKLKVCFPFKPCKFVCWQLLLPRTVQMSPQGHNKRNDFRLLPALCNRQCYEQYEGCFQRLSL